MKFYLQTEGMQLHRPIIKILKLRSDDDFDIWQLETFDELIPMNVDICKLNDKDIEIVIEVINVGKGSMKIYRGSVLKSGLQLICISNTDSLNVDDCAHFESVLKLEKALYMRKSKEVPNWQVNLMKEKLKETKRQFFDLNPEIFIINLIIPIPSHALILRARVESE